MYGKMRLTTSAGSRSSGTSTAYFPARRRARHWRLTPSARRRDPLSQPRAARTQLINDADELVAGCERRLRAAEIGAGAYQRIGERHAGSQSPDAHLARTWTGIRILHNLQ